MSILSVLAAIGVLALLIVVHELGHFLAARWQGIHVNRFSVGFGPVLWKYQGKQTEYALRGIPLGGYVGFPDDDPTSPIPPDDPDLLKNRPILDRAIVISAGVIANLLFAYLVLVTQVAVVGIQQVNYSPGVLIQEVLSLPNQSQAAAQAGLKSGDTILRAGEQSFEASEQTVEQFRQLIQASEGKPLLMQVKRGDQTLNLTVTPQPMEDSFSIGIRMRPNVASVQNRKARGLGEIFTQAAADYQRLTLDILKGFGQILSNFGATAGQVSGPVGIVNQVSQYARTDLKTLFVITAALSINLAIINILPLPALDGGQLSFLLVEAVRGRPLPESFQAGVMQTGLFLLLGLGVFLTVKDTLAWISQRALP